MNESILMNLLRGCRKFIFKLFTKERRKSLEFSEMFASVINEMIFMFDHCWKGRKSFINICYLYDFFPYSFHVILTLDEVMGEVILLVSFFFFLFGLSFTNIHDSRDSRGRGRLPI